eukprot:CAMPEP_0174250112 /NCGR_PEP_ID=MMETSP0439-20130205/386_1 /TAXON_ID=0 /ORGANISM="Stereomyxa ramosa, Strain Chinc5" /LENGTH=63 /DNA_ID=CAMNT_0015330101 /DNA_START=162 /DNA_END=353 /DNA_ORIENTATION=+
MTVYTTDTGRDLKRRICDKFGITREIELWHNDLAVMIDDNQDVGSYEPVDDDEIQVTEKVPGG